MTPFAALHHANTPLLLPQRLGPAPRAALLAARGLRGDRYDSLGVAAAAELQDGQQQPGT